MPHTIEPAPTGRAKCRGCGQPIAKGDQRFGERVPNPYADGDDAESTLWFHLPCAAFKRPEPLMEALATTTEGVESRDVLESEARLGITHRRVVRVDVVSRAPSARAACRACKEKIDRGSWRVALVYFQDGRFVPSGYIHLACAFPYLETRDVLPRARHFSPELSPDDWLEIQSLLGAPPRL